MAPEQTQVLLRTLCASLHFREGWGQGPTSLAHHWCSAPKSCPQVLLVFLEFRRPPRRWGPSAGSPRLADLEPAENLFCWRVMRCSLCKLVTGLTSAAPDFLLGVLGVCLQNSPATFPLFPSSLFMQVQHSVLHVPWQVDSTI